MDLRTFDNKNIVDGKVIMTEPTLVFTEQTSTIAKHLVSFEEAGRPDLIALYYYSIDNATDLILKWNGISNPFSMSEGDIIEIPSMTSVFEKFVKPSRSNGPTKKDQFISERRMTQKDIKRLDFIQAKASLYKNGSKSPLPPNVLKDGETNTRVVGQIREANGPLNTEEPKK